MVGVELGLGDQVGCPAQGQAGLLDQGAEEGLLVGPVEHFPARPPLGQHLQAQGVKGEGFGIKFR